MSKSNHPAITVVCAFAALHHLGRPVGLAALGLVRRRVRPGPSLFRFGETLRQPFRNFHKRKNRPHGNKIDKPLKLNKTL